MLVRRSRKLVRRAASLALPLILASACADQTTQQPQLITNPAPLAHLTYKCSVLQQAATTAPADLIYMVPYDPSTPTCAVDWDGRLQKELQRRLPERQSPHGSRLLVIDYPFSSAFNGQNEPFLALTPDNFVLARYTTIWGREAMWADDSRHLCYIRDSVREDLPAGQGLLMVDIPGGESRTVGTIGSISRHLPQAVAGSNHGPAPVAVVKGPQILACSMQANRAVILDEVQGVIKLLQLSDGKQLSSHAYGRSFGAPTDPKDLIVLVASRDGHYVAEQFAADGTPTAHTITIRDLLSEQVVATFASAQVTAFSWDGSRALVEKGGNSAVVDWRSGRIIRQLAGFPSGGLARPASQDMVVCVPSTRHAFGCDLYIVRESGDAFEMARSVQVPFGL